MTRQPRLDSLRMFDAAARHLNFRRAAEELTLTQSAVAQRVRQLEDDLGVALFVRQARGLVLTRKGQQYHRRLKPALAMIDEATRQLCASAGPLKISVTPSFASKWLLPRLPLFRDTYPEVNLELEASERLADFFVDGVDFAIRMGRPPFGEGLQHHRLAGIGLCALCSPDYLARQGGTIDLTDLVDANALQRCASPLGPLRRSIAGSARSTPAALQPHQPGHRRGGIEPGAGAGPSTAGSRAPRTWRAGRTLCL